MSEAASDSPVAKAIRVQIYYCRAMHAPLYAGLLQHCEQDLDPGSPIDAVIGDWPGDPIRDFVPLRMLGGVHQLVLEGALSELAAHYPSTCGSPRFPEVWPLFRAAVAEHRARLREFLKTTPQTNEIGRAAALMLGFHQVSRAFALPLRLRELGASAGLNLLWDRYAYQLGDLRWGAEDGPLLRPEWSGPGPSLCDDVAIESRAGCDLAPIDVTDAAASSRLEAYVWPDHPERLERLRAAIAIARRDPPKLTARAAGEWIAEQLAQRSDGVATVVYHSSFWPYLSDAESAAIRKEIERKGADATRRSPLAWLRLEDVEGDFDKLRLRMWPGGEDQILADTQAHGRKIRWRDG